MSEQSIPQIIELADGTKCVRLEDFLNERDEAREELHKKYIEFDKLFHEAEQIRIERDECYQKITDLESELRGVGLLRDEAIRQLENIKASSIHSCHDQCQRPMCVLRRERDKWEETAHLYCQNSDYHREMREKAERERDEAKQQLRIAVGLLSTHPQFANKHPEDVLAFVKEGVK